jgi:hypothetical protein
MSRIVCLFAALLLVQQQPPPIHPPPQPASPVPATRLQTRWAALVDRSNVLPEYPRPQMVRKNWQNLNGEWSYAITHRYSGRPSTFGGNILVPFPIESQLSGASVWVTPDQRLWYRRTFTVPTLPAGQRLLLHFGAVDWEAVVSVNGKEVGQHRGGYDPFTFDITDALKTGASSAEQELIVAVRDPTDGGDQPRGKQVSRPRSIYYTAVTGIWQTVWLEPVPDAHITNLRIDSEVDAGSVTVTVSASQNSNVTVTALEGDREVGRQSGASGSPLTFSIARPRTWGPSDPFLYRLRARLETGDEVEGYFGMRSIAVKADPGGVRRLYLNGQPLFQLGLLDQGWWPDGLYTAPTDEALVWDIEKTKELGFNVIRKHVKVEPARWYYHCDRLGMIVWQDMPSAQDMSPAGEPIFARELRAMVDALRNHPSIVMWVPFNEDWGQHATEKHVAWLKSYDPSRIVNNASGWDDMKVGDVVDLHAYPGPAMPPLEKGRASVLGEFGGLGLPLDGHTWLDRGNWGYRSYTTQAELNTAYQNLLAQLRMHAGDGLSSAIYTQTTDVEIEVNGVMTYDRSAVKLSPESIAANKRMYDPPPVIGHLLASSDRSPQTWRYTTTAPAANWFEPSFADSGWSSGPGGFGAPATRHARVGTPWQTPDIWLRRTFDVAVSIANPYLRVFHDDDTKIYVNGTLVADLPGANAGYAFVPLVAPARNALRRGKNTLAVHTHQTRGGQFIDVGIVNVADR